MPLPANHLVIIGGNAAGMSAASRARRNNPRLKITVVEKSAHVSYGACGLPYYLSDDIKEWQDLLVVSEKQFREERNIEILLRHEATSFDPRKRLVWMRDRRDDSLKKILYDRLIIASGARPIVPDIPGTDLENVHTLRTLDDGRAIKQWLAEERNAKAVVIGGGYIGLEVAEALLKQGLKPVIIEMRDQLMPQLDRDMAALVQNELSAAGCEMWLSSRVTALNGRQAVQSLSLACGKELEAGLVVLAAGVQPNVELARSGGVVLGRSGAIQVDARMKTNIVNVYAAGDCAEAKNQLTNKYDWLPLGTTANKQGRVAGDNASGRVARFEGIVATSLVKVLGLEVARSGISAAHAEGLRLPVKSVTVKAGTRAGYYPGRQELTVKLIFRRGDGRLLGAQLVGREGAAKRIDVLATALHQKMTVFDLAGLDLSYAPPYAPVWDPILIAANQACKMV